VPWGLPPHLPSFRGRAAACSQPMANTIVPLACMPTQYSTVQYNTVQSSTVQYSTVQYSPVKSESVFLHRVRVLQLSAPAVKPSPCKPLLPASPNFKCTPLAPAVPQCTSWHCSRTQQAPSPLPQLALHTSSDPLKCLPTPPLGTCAPLHKCPTFSPGRFRGSVICWKRGRGAAQTRGVPGRRTSVGGAGAAPLHTCGGRPRASGAPRSAPSASEMHQEMPPYWTLALAKGLTTEKAIE